MEQVLNNDQVKFGWIDACTSVVLIVLVSFMILSLLYWLIPVEAVLA